MISLFLKAISYVDLVKDAEFENSNRRPRQWNAAAIKHGDNFARSFVVIMIVQ